MKFGQGAQRAPFKDGLSNEERANKRRQAWDQSFTETKRGKAANRFWTSKLCTECRQWNERLKPEEWCEHLRGEGAPLDPASPNVQTFKPYFHPNAQVGGAFLRSKAEERACFKMNNVESAG